MLRRTWLTFIIVVLCLLCPVRTFCDEVRIFIRDEVCVIPDGDIYPLNELCNKIYNSCGVSVHCLIHDSKDEEGLCAHAHELFGEPDDKENRVVLAVSGEEWYVYFSGNLASLTAEEDKSRLFDAFCGGKNYSYAAASYIKSAGELLFELGLSDSPPISDSDLGAFENRPMRGYSPAARAVLIILTSSACAVLFIKLRRKIKLHRR